MRCPACQHEDSRVVDSRTAGDAIRRRRQCAACGERFTTHERIERRYPWVIKRDGRRELFSREKLLHGIALACRKRPVDEKQMEDAADRVALALAPLSEVGVDRIGDEVLLVLRDVDPVAYVRFASVYQQFESVEQFIDAIAPLRNPR